MAQAGFTPIQLYYSTTASAVPTAGNLASGELAINISDGKLYYKNASNVVTLLATAGSVSSQWVTSGSDIYYNTGNVGIGTTSPAYKFHVQNASANTDTFVGQSSTVGLFTQWRYNATTASAYGEISTYGGSNALYIQGQSGGGNTIINPTSGNVGIGTSSPGAKLEIGALGVFRMQTGSTVFNTTPTAGATDLLVWNTSNAGSGFAWNTNSVEKARITPGGDLLVGTTTTNGKITSVTSGVGIAGYFSSSGSTNTLVVIDTGANGANIKLTGDGATTPSKTIRAQAGSLQVINNAYSAAILTLTDAGNLTAAGNVTAYSDERLKKDWSPIAGGFIDQLASVKSGTYTRTDSGERQVGVSAQDLQKMLTEAVSADNAGYLSVAYGNAALVACVELAKEVIALRAEIAALR